jgi:hypothetical protein
LVFDILSATKQQTKVQIPPRALGSMHMAVGGRSEHRKQQQEAGRLRRRWIDALKDETDKGRYRSSFEKPNLNQANSGGGRG